MRFGWKSIFGYLALALALCATEVEAYDQQITSNLWAEGYSITTPGGDVLMRRRFVEDLHLAAWNLVEGSDDPYYKGPRVFIDLALRLDTDFGVGRNESDPTDSLNYVPGLNPLKFQAMVANLNIMGLWNDTLDMRLGRQIRIDTLGFFAFDGVETRLNMPLGIGLDTYAGFEVREGHALGYDALELDGTDSGGRHDMEADQYPGRTEPKARLAIGTELSVSPKRWFDVALNYRAIGLNSAIADERLGGRMTIGGEPVLVDARGVWCPLVGRVCEVDAEVGVSLAEPVTVYVDYHFFRPVFEADSIFNVFDLSDQNDLGGRVEVRFSKKLSSAIWGFTRLADGSFGLDGTTPNSLLSGAGGGIGGNYRTPVSEMSVRTSVVQEWGENQLGGEIGMGHAFFRGGRLWLRVRGSIWHIDDAFSPRLNGNIAGYVLSARFRIADRAHLLGEFENYVGGGREARFLALALLQLDLWR